MEDDRTKLLNKAIEMRTRGERYQSIVGHLRHNCKDEAEVRAIITKMDELEGKGLLERGNQSRVSIPQMIGGAVLLIVGVILLKLLWGLGYVSVFPFVVMIAGSYLLTGTKGISKLFGGRR